MPDWPDVWSTIQSLGSAVGELVGTVAGAVDSAGTVLSLLFGGYVGGRATVVARFRAEHRWDLLASDLPVLARGIPSAIVDSDEWFEAMANLAFRVPMLAWSDRQLWRRVLASVPVDHLQTVQEARQALAEVDSYWSRRLDFVSVASTEGNFNKQVDLLRQHWSDRLNPSFQARFRARKRFFWLIATFRRNTGHEQANLFLSTNVGRQIRHPSARIRY